MLTNHSAPGLAQYLGPALAPIAEVIFRVTIEPLILMFTAVWLGIEWAQRNTEPNHGASPPPGDPMGMAIVGVFVVCLAVIIGFVLLLMLIALVRGKR